MQIQQRRILGVTVHATSYTDATQRILSWARTSQSRYVCVCNVHMIMEARDDPPFREIVNGADLVTPDGMPLVWALRLMAVPEATRVYGPDLMLALCAAAEQSAIPVGLYGGTTAVLDLVREHLRQRFPELAVTYAHSPPFGPEADDFRAVEGIRSSGARILFVALGCPKQEWWMARNRDNVPAAMVGVGAAFDFIARVKPQAPRLVQAMGLEWAFRLATEPRRLWRRYALHNPRFLGLLGWQLLRQRRPGRTGSR
jgi:N-acetylglucosaminyldiphosphoundecaprenol N-acetyl-beta-D-mannosaminyltransferase